ncbi:MAG: CHAT domain-containing protein [Bacteroidota bacterium]
MRNPFIFLAFADSRQDLPELKEERLALKEMLLGSFQVIDWDSATQGRVVDVFRVYKSDIRVFHFSGHANGEQIQLLSNSDGRSGGYIKGLAKFIGQQKGVELVFINGCSSEGQVSYFKKAGIPAVIATTHDIGDAYARQFATLFYESFISVGGKIPLREAFNEAENLMKARFPDGPTGPGRRIRAGALSWDDFPYKLHLRTDRAGDLCLADLALNDNPEGAPVPAEAQLLVNRYQAEDDFKDTLEDFLLDPPANPILAFAVPGDESELPEELCRRLYLFSIPQTFEKLDKDLEPSRTIIERVSMPRLEDYVRPYRAMGRVRESLKSVLDLNEFPVKRLKSLTGEHILQSLGKHIRAIVLEHRLYADDWDRDRTPAFLREYLGQFWAMPREQVQEQDEPTLVLLLFSLEYPPKKGLFANWKKASEKHRVAFESLSSVLPPLKPIPRKDTRKWNNEFAPDDPTLTERLYSKKKAMPFREIYPELKATVERRRRNG